MPVPNTCVYIGSHEPRRSIHGPRLSSTAGRLLESLEGENEESQRAMMGNPPPGASETFISLHEIVQNGLERPETTQLTEQYFSFDDVGRQQPKAKTTQEVRHMQFSLQREAGTSDPDEEGRPIRREESFQSTTTTLVRSSRASVAEENVGHDVPTVEIGDGVAEDSNQDLYARLSPILVVGRLPSVYDTATRTANGNSPSNYRLYSSLSARPPVGRTTDPPPTQAAPDPITGEEAPAGAPGFDGPPPQPPTTSIEQETLQAPGRLISESGAEESLVESSVLLRVSIVNRSSENLPISLENNDHSTLEYVQFIETASHRRYSFTSEHLTVPNGFFRRSTCRLHRMLSARSRFIMARSRSLVRRIQREVDLEMQNPDAAWQEPNNQPDGPVELYGPGPVELDATPAVSSSHENLGPLGTRPGLNRAFTRSETLSRMTCAIFGPNLPRQLGPMCKVYMKQVDDQLISSMENHELQTPNTLNWPSPLSYLEECLKVVASRMESTMSIEDFVHQHMAYLMILMEQGPMTARITPELGQNPVLNREYLRIANEWILFCLEAWTMLDMTAICKNRHDLRLSEKFCKSPLKDTIESLLPRLIAKFTHHNTTPYTYSSGKVSQIFPREMTAEMLQELAGVTFVWTDDITKHLVLDTKKKSVGLYSHVAFVYLHTEAGTESSLYKLGLVPYHHLLTEIFESYLLLFGDTERSRKLFNDVDPEGRSPGYFDIFSLNGRLDSNPKWLYNSNEDFPVFGDRLIELKSLLKPKGLRGLWRDTRDSLQWYTFWAVAVIGGIGLFLGFVQMVVGAVQAYASLKALHQ